LDFHGLHCANIMLINVGPTCGPLWPLDMWGPWRSKKDHPWQAMACGSA